MRVRKSRMKKAARRIPKISQEQVKEIQGMQGSLREIAKQYGVAHTSIRDIRNRWRVLAAGFRPEREQFITPIGTVAAAHVIEPRYNKFYVRLRLSALDAQELIKRVKASTAQALSAAAEEGKLLPYSRNADGSYTFTFNTRKAKPPIRPKLLTVSGNPLKRPEQVKPGRRAAVTYTVISWSHYGAYGEGGEIGRSAGTRLGLAALTLYSQKRAKRRAKSK